MRKQIPESCCALLDSCQLQVTLSPRNFSERRIQPSRQVAHAILPFLLCCRILGTGLLGNLVKAIRVGRVGENTGNEDRKAQSSKMRSLHSCDLTLTLRFCFVFKAMISGCWMAVFIIIGVVIFFGYFIFNGHIQKLCNLPRLQ